MPKKILIVEDDQFISKMYKKKFEVAGHEVQVAGDGEEGVTKTKAFKPNVILMDIMMPKMNGLEALDIIKKDAELKAIPVIILTNLSTTDDAETAMKKGAAKYIIKSDVTPSQVVAEAEKLAT